MAERQEVRVRAWAVTTEAEARGAVQVPEVRADSQSWKTRREKDSHLQIPLGTQPCSNRFRPLTSKITR